MIYYMRNKKTLEEFQNKEDRELLNYLDVLDVRNYAITIIYGNNINEEEQILRTVNLQYHYKALLLLYEKSKYLKKMVKKSDIDMNHFTFDDILIKNNHAILFHHNVDGTNNHEGATLILPESLNDYQLTFLKKREQYLAKFPYLGIEQYQKEEINELCGYEKNDHHDVLKKIINYK